jgi:hypothetical protein
MSQQNQFTKAVSAIRSASALTESTFLRVGQTLEESVGILAELTSRFAVVLGDLEGEKLGLALQALSGVATQVRQLGQHQSEENAKFERMRCLTESIGVRIAHMKTSLKDVDSLAVNSRIAAAGIRAVGSDFTTFADEIGRTLALARTALDRFGAELHAVRKHVAAAQTSQRLFDQRQRNAASSITERLSATMKSIAQQHQRAANASLEVRLGGTRVRQRICDAILALQIGDITRQRLEHADTALNLVAGSPLPNDDEQRVSAAITHRLQTAQLADAALNFDRDVRQVTVSLNSLAAEARALRNLGDAAYGVTNRGGGSFIAELEGQIAEALTMFEDFETARADIANVTATVSDATAGLCRHLRTVQSLEADIRIMGLNTTFRCARIGREGLALSVIAQELRGYANGFAKEAATLLGEVETVAGISGSLIGGTMGEQGVMTSEGTLAMRDSLATLRQMGQTLDAAMLELDRDSERVVALLNRTVADLAAQAEIGQVMRDAAGNLETASPPGDFNLAALPPRVEQMLASIELGYTMAGERAVHDRILGRSSMSGATAAKAAAMEDFLF